jgi:hypothetical protein
MKMARKKPADELQTGLARLRHLRQQNSQEYRQWTAPLKAWQSARLKITYADLAAIPTYAPATAFFLTDLYGTHDLTDRDASLDRIVPTMVKILPGMALGTIAKAIEMDALTEELDQMMATAWRDVNAPALDDAAYGVLYRSVGCRPMRARQVALVREVGSSLNMLIKVPAISATLTAMKIPAQLAGVGPLHGFLERGFKAFKTMGDATDFIATVERRETHISDQLYANAPNPFDRAVEESAAPAKKRKS